MCDRDTDVKFSLGGTKINSNKSVRGTRLRMAGHVLRQDCGCVGQRILRLELPRRRKRWRLQRNLWMLTEDMK